ncbi:hypothetical protein DDB_G0285287 [Dictyostelium discoideum AX4]|uniref:Probable DNA repair protein RAD51 homolog 4 n=1 Tax=Dictyostelium discoideum TaxID=44689 RepID=RA51D_DICDI|nr:hypothetical protein DDB_G0285287 [Dictyostelium discoideum AX4]Q1ZXF0.1 RecName: Full=Probable DNA repair protein RAD51 homolog 4 [Dictyostelium discoideum]EAS66855.1 hypothetical protein DDB_G0285287 [Dictyostelium discoideum AX4]|eukprot:XP_001134538.1 hypothetical protein DDB_G0285287 [Dictyostelium discoideum AX4]
MEEESISGLEVRFYQTQCLSEDNVIKFENNGYPMIDLILFSDAYQIQRNTSIPIETVTLIQRNLQRLFSSVPINGYQHYLDVKEFKTHYSSGIKLLDQLLGGNGFTSGEIYELVGNTSCGKTQISMCCSLNLSQQYNSNIIYIDSSNSFSPPRLIEIFKSNYLIKQRQKQQQKQQQKQHQKQQENNDKIEQDKILKILDRIKVFNCFDSITLLELLSTIDSTLSIISDEIPTFENQFYKGLKMVVIDSIGTLLAPIIGGKQTQGHYTMMMISRLIKYIADTYQIIFLITNNTVGGNSFDNKAALGEAWSMVPNHQLMINHQYNDDENEERSIYIEKSTRLPVSIIFIINLYWLF